MRILTVEDARDLGCPVEDSNMFDGGEIIGLRFEPFQETWPSLEISVALGIYHYFQHKGANMHNHHAHEKNPNVIMYMQIYLYVYIFPICGFWPVVF